MFIERLRHSVAETGASLCVGLDPHPGRMPAGAGDDPSEVRRFLCEVIDRTAEHTAVYKPNSAFFERLGPEGIRVLADVIDHVHSAGRPVILDAKRCDIASTAAAYASAAFERLSADALTVVPYTGEDTILPFVEAGGFVFLLTLPSNPSAAAIVKHGSPPFYLRIAEMGRDVAERFPNQVGLVVGATDAAGAEAVAEIDPDLPWLIPGIGAQGGDLVTFCTRVGGKRILLFSASRSVLFAKDPGAAARELKERMQHECTPR